MAADGATMIVELALPMERLTLLPEANARQGLFTVFLAARDENGNGTDVAQKTIPLRLRAEDSGRDYVYQVAMPLPHGHDYRVAAAVRDELAGEVSYVVAEVRLRKGN